MTFQRLSAFTFRAGHGLSRLSDFPGSLEPESGKVGKDPRKSARADGFRVAEGLPISFFFGGRI